MHRQVVSVDHRGYGVDEKWHVVIDHLDKRISGRVPVFLVARVVDSQLGLSLVALCSEIQVAQCDLRHDLGGATLEILDGNICNVLVEVMPDLFATRQMLRFDRSRENLLDDITFAIAASAQFFTCH